MASPQSTPVQLPLFVLDKRCNTCDRVKPLEEFHCHRGTADGRTALCKECAKARSHAWHRDNKERVAARGRVWRATHAQELAASKHAYYVSHKIESQAYHRERYARERDALLEQQRLYRAEHLAERRLAARQKDARYGALVRDYSAAGEKHCACCRVLKALTEFHRKRRTRDGYNAYCKECARAKVRAWYSANTERALAARRLYRVVHAARITARSRERYRVQQAERNAQQRAYRQQHRADLAAAARLYRQLHPAIMQAQSHRRRAREREAQGSHTGQQWATLCDLYGQVCLCCGAQAPLEADHIQPLSKGGSDDISNIQPLCRPCNRRKSAQTIDYRPKAKG